MKKVLSLLLVLVICLSLGACGGGDTPNTNETPNASNNNNETQTEEFDSEKTETANTESQNATETITLTLDNWQNYFEIRVYAEPKTNDFDEVDKLRITAFLVLKDDYVDRYVSADGTVEVKKSGQNATAVEYNLETKELTLVPSDDISTKEWTDTVSLDDYEEIGLDLGVSIGTNSGTLEQTNNIITAVSQFYRFIEITRIEGTLCLSK